MQNKYRLFGKIPVADILIALLLLALLAAGMFIIFRDDVQAETGADAQVQTEQTHPVTLTLAVIQTNAANVPLVAEGDELFFKDGKYFGKVISATSSPFVQYKADREGKYVATPMEDSANIYLTVECEATSRDVSGIYVGGKRVFYTTSLSLCNEKYVWRMNVVKIDREEATR
ncbi:MAG: DUF4330 family protein [Clostridia bacterium]|nr:DUF4330 family protein [Clostridia bacterium]